MNKWYAVSGHRPEIEELDVVKETEKTLLVNSKFWDRQTRMLKRDSTTACFPTWKEAHDFLIEKLEKKTKYQRERLKDTEDALATARALKEGAPHDSTD